MLYDSKYRMEFCHTRDKNTLLLCFVFLPGDVAIARLSKIQKKKRCIFIMATVSKEPTYICGFEEFCGNEKLNERRFSEKKKKI